MKLQLFAGAGFLALGAAGLAQAQDGASPAERHWAAITECAAIGNADRRHRCMDDVARQAGVLDPVKAAEAVRQEFGREDRPLAPPPAAVRQPSAPAVAATPDVSRITTTVRSVTTVGFRLLRVVTADGSVWEQTQAEDFTVGPRAGDAFAVERTTLGGYRCQFARSSRYYCRRVD